MYNRARPNDPLLIAAEDWNSCLDAARAHRNSPVNQRPPDLAVPAGSYLAAIGKNDTGTDLRERGIVRLTDPLFVPGTDPRPFLNQLAFRAQPPQEGENIAICLRPLPNTTTGPFVIAGLIAAQVKIFDLQHQYATPIGNETNFLGSADVGPAKIRWMDSPMLDAIRWAVLDLGGTEPPTRIVAGIVKTTFNHLATTVTLEDLRHVAGQAFAIDETTELPVENPQLLAGFAGQTALAMYNEAESRWELTYLAAPALVWFRATLGHVLTNTSTTAQLNNLSPMGQFVTLPTTVTARNERKFSGDANDPCIGLYDPMHPTNPYELWSVPLRYVPLIQSLFIDDTDPAGPKVMATRRKCMVHTWTAGEETIEIDPMTVCNT